MTYEQDRVRNFMKTFGQECPNYPTQLDESTAKLRASLILEEVFETITKGLGLRVFVDKNGDYISIGEEDLKNNLSFDFFKEKEVDLVELADGIGDVVVVSLGTSIAAGIDQEPINKDIFDSNDTKLWLEQDLDKAPEGFTATKIDGGLYIVRGQNGKVAKPPTYRAADPGKFIQEQINKENDQLNLDI